MNNIQTLLVVWQEENSRSYYHIGTLSYYNGFYEFNYTSREKKGQLGDALEHGYVKHPLFPDPDKKYRSKKLFPAFNQRIPSSNRKDYDSILDELGLGQDANQMDILRATRGRLAGDSYSFEQPLRIEEDNRLSSRFFIHGMRYQNLPEDWYSIVTKNPTLYLKSEPNNEYDEYAVAIYTYRGFCLGYVPAFYSKAISSLIKQDLIPKIRVVRVNKQSDPHWWVQVDLECEVPHEMENEVEELLIAI
ncbi:hypothetical protein BW727_101046 [Jeotgalibaca dankookensis]|uniref:HIRAN domain-containing protein n=1 Tax=Jeotgalibaca dankookensis TaxID=708126 RepID=A0A1S6IPF8_9LACT|nr:HIRAN domain-containing protein [Jeotgalibaca dankookensis]AQS53416.1 hypothetical protein BW727_101046 [Jeotgalibaca dankookensis]